jgi:hypothetical protein
MGVLFDVHHAGGAPTSCHGPVDGRCPLLEGCGCQQFEEADGIVFALDLDDAANRAVLARYRELRPDLAIHVITTVETAAQWPDLLEGTIVVTKEDEIAALLADVDQT